jgi:tetratricopeptide (TPR) repeat protein
MATEGFGEVLRHFIGEYGIKLTYLSEQTDISIDTIKNWLYGKAGAPRDWQTVVKLAIGMRLNLAESTRLLKSADYGSILELWAEVTNPADKALLSYWAEEIRLQQAKAPFLPPDDLSYFVGREEVIEALRKALLAGHHTLLYSLEGMGGVGKSAIAIHIAHQLRPHFPDGVLWAKLDSSDTMSILEIFANEYGRDVSDYTEPAVRSTIVRGILADKRALIILDNARTSDEVEPLLPSTGSSAVIVTTRNQQLSVARSGHGRKFPIMPFDKERGESLALFAKHLGKQASKNKEPLLEIADLLGHLPLAVDIAASRLADESGENITGFLERIRDEMARLNEMTYENKSVRAIFNLSYEDLSPAMKRLYAALGAISGEDFSVDAAAYITETSLAHTKESLMRLQKLSLLQPGRSTRYRLHTLLRLYAREKIADESAFERMVEYFIGYLGTHQKDYAALDLEAGNIVAAIQTASEREKGPTLARNINTVYEFLEARGLYDVAETYLERVERLARADGDSGRLSAALLNQGRVARLRANYRHAMDYLEESLKLARELEDREQISTVLMNIGMVVANFPDYERAEAYFLEGLRLARQLRNRELIGSQLHNLGWVANMRGYYDEAEKYYQEGLRLAQESGHEGLSGVLLQNLGTVVHARGDLARAEECYQQALTIARKIGHEDRVSTLLTNLGVLARDQKKYPAAKRHYREALTIARKIGHVTNISILLANLSEIEGATGNYEEAEKNVQESLKLARETKNSWLIKPK